MDHNILLISTIYPLPEGNRGTSVCHFFAREWVRSGYNVKVIHIQAVFPLFFYWLARLARNIIAAKTGAVVYTHRDTQDLHYEMDGVSIERIPVYKPLPHGAYPKRSICKTIEKIISCNQKNNFEPDIIIGHFPNPQIELLSLLKRSYSSAKTCIVMHGDLDIMRKVYGERLPKLMADIDVWGFRSKTVKEEFEALVGVVHQSFICYSGIPESYLISKNERKFSDNIHDFIFVGDMIERKYPVEVLEALCLAYPENDFHLTFVGDGQLISDIGHKVEDRQLYKQVSIIGRIPREKILDEYDKAECMVMISRDEAYGLVYLEAMSRGCIVIASKREGFDGVIVDGENGFLCEAGSVDHLARLIKRINNLSAIQRQKISENAVLTAKRLTDHKVAEHYINSIIG